LLPTYRYSDIGVLDPTRAATARMVTSPRASASASAIAAATMRSRLSPSPRGGAGSSNHTRLIAAS
jgi:hypothetical protein